MLIDDKIDCFVGSGSDENGRIYNGFMEDGIVTYYYEDNDEEVTEW
jgi:hypothetical protein